MLPGRNPSDSSNLTIRIALSYAAFLFLLLILALVIYMSSLNAARESYWQQESAQLKSNGATMSSYLITLNNYTHQLNTYSTLQRFAAMDGRNLDAEYVLTAWEVMQFLNTRAYGLFQMPVRLSHIYLTNSGYVISASQFTESEQFYRAYRGFTKGKYEDFIDLLLSADQQGMWCDMSAYTDNPESLFFISSLDSRLRSSLPAVIWFEVDKAALLDLFLPRELQSEASVLLLDKQGEPMLVLGNQNEQLLTAMQSAQFDEVGMSRHADWQLLRQTDPAGWTYIAALPQRLCDAAVDSHSTLMIILFMTALLLGVVMITVLVHRAMHPYHQLNLKLTQAVDDKEQLQREIDAQRPLLKAAYVRKLLSGHMSSADEADYIMDYLGLSGGSKHFYVLYCIAHQQNAASDASVPDHDKIAAAIEQYLTIHDPIYYYTTLDHSFVVLVSYEGDPNDSLMDLQQRVIQLHDMLADSCALWFYAGVGGCCNQASRLWESYEQSRTAARYTARHHVFLPYDFIKKDTDSWYYPIELSAKFLHFITTGNHQQVSDLLSLIHRENVTERNLPVSLLNMLLSDLRNTLFKARFQIPQPSDDEARERLEQLDKRLYEAPAFSNLESNALALCDFFVKFTTPNDPIADVELYLQNNYTDPSLCLAKLSERFNISESYMSHLFKVKTGVNFSVYLERLRMEAAAEQLQSGTGNLSTLYADLGYSSAASFRRAFKKYHGITPSEMRGKSS